MSAKRVLLVEMNEDGTTGGSHQALFDQIRLMDRSRFEPVVVYYQVNAFEPRLRDLGVEVHSYQVIRDRERAVRRSGNPIRKSLDILGAILRRRTFLRRTAIDLVHLNNYPWLGADDWLPAARLCGIPCITWARNDLLGPVGPVGGFLARRFDRVVAISEYMVGVMRRHGIPQAKLELIPHGVDVEDLRGRVRRTAASVREELGIAPGQVLAVMVGNIRRWKGQHIVLSALRGLDPSHRGRIRAVFVGAEGVGDDAYATELREAVRDWGLEQCVTFLGRRDDVPDLLAAADMAIHASVLPEPAGLVILEAMALGAPIVAADQGGPVEYLADGAGRTFDVREPAALTAILAEISQSEHVRRELASRASERVTRFTLARNVELTQDLYARLLGAA